MPPNVIKRAAEFCSSPKLERVFDNFSRLGWSIDASWSFQNTNHAPLREHADVFMDAVEAKGEVEHKHECVESR